MQHFRLLADRGDLSPRHSANAHHFFRSAQRTLTVMVLELPDAPLASVTVSFALKLPVLV
jgi:hypothetical protein